MLPYATEQQVVKIVNEKLKESGAAPSKDTIISIVNEAIERGEIEVGGGTKLYTHYMYFGYNKDGKSFNIYLNIVSPRQEAYTVESFKQYVLNIGEAFQTPIFGQATSDRAEGHVFMMSWANSSGDVQVSGFDKTDLHYASFMIFDILDLSTLRDNVKEL